MSLKYILKRDGASPGPCGTPFLSVLLFFLSPMHKKSRLVPLMKGDLQSKLIECINKANNAADTIATYVKDTSEK